MMQVQALVGSLLEKGYDFWAGVPCSFLKPLINYAIESPAINYIGASNEGEALAIAIGAHLAGRKAVVICQNSGLGNMVNPLTSLNYPFRVPTLLIVTHRGAPGVDDEPQHNLIGLITEDILTTMRIPWKVLDAQVKDATELIDEADKYMTGESLPYALIMRKGAVTAYQINQKKGHNSCIDVDIEGDLDVTGNRRLLRSDAIKTIRSLLTRGELIIGTTGKIGRELFSLGHSPNQFYVLGGMGCASAIGLGLSLCQSKFKVVILDGDGAALMKMGTLATIGHYNPSNLIHIVLDNEAHESTGGQQTVSGSIDFAKIASACSYKAVYHCDSDVTLAKLVKKAINSTGPVMIHVKIALGSDPNLGRPTLTPVQIKEQFMRYVVEK